MNIAGKYSVAQALVILSLSWSTSVGAVDCGLVDDEFDSLMNRTFLISPEKFSEGYSQKISRKNYNARQKGKFRLWLHRKRLGVGIVKTNRGHYGKFLYTWGESSSGSANPDLLISELTLFSNLEKNNRPRRYRNINIPSSYALDIDTGKIEKGKSSDIWFHNVDGVNMSIEAKNGAKLFFPTTSLCTQQLAVVALPIVNSIQNSQGVDQNEEIIRSINENGDVVFEFPDGTIKRYYEGGFTTTSPDGLNTSSSYSTQAPAAVPPVVPDQAHQLWLESHNDQLLHILRDLVDHDQAAMDNYLDFEGDGVSVYQRIELRGRTIGRLLLN